MARGMSLAYLSHVQVNLEVFQLQKEKGIK